MRRSGHVVIIAGGGPTGLMLAGELALAGVDVGIVERRVDQSLGGSRAGGLHARTIEIFDQRGIAERFLREGQKAQVAGFAGVNFDLGRFPTRHPYSLGLWQADIERILGSWVAELNVPIHRSLEVIGLAQDDSGVEVMLSDGSSMQANYLVGCDGGRSFVRKAAGIAFPGTEPTTSNLIAEAELATTPPEWGIRRDALGIHSIGRVKYEIYDGRIVYADEGPVRVLVTEPQVGTGEPTLCELSAAMTAAFGTDYGIHSVASITRFTDAARQAATYRSGRVLVAGDAAHIHPPDGGQGLQTGVQDAVNLGWKLAQVVKGISAESLLDSYHAERHSVAAWVLRHTLASVLLRREDPRTRALRDTMVGFLAMDEPRKTYAAMLSGLGIHYDFGEGHPLLGRRMPDVDLTIADAEVPVYSQLHGASPLLINFGRPGAVDLLGWADRVRLIDATYAGPWELPVLGPVSAPEAVLVRPDGYVAWVGQGPHTGLTDALATWFGPPAA